MRWRCACERRFKEPLNLDCVRKMGVSPAYCHPGQGYRTLERLTCCSAQCCQLHINVFQDKLMKLEKDNEIPRGSTWSERTHSYDDERSEKRSRSQFKHARSPRHKAIKSHLACLESFANGEGLTNELRVLCNDVPLALPFVSITLPLDDLDTLDEGFPQLQEAHEKSAAGKDDLARYNTFLHQNQNPFGYMYPAPAKCVTKDLEWHVVALQGSTLVEPQGGYLQPEVYEQPHLLQ